MDKDDKLRNSAATPGAGERRSEPVFSDFDEEEGYEESDRDTDYASAYEEEIDEEDYDPFEDGEESDEEAQTWQLLPGTAPEPGTGSPVRSRNPWDVDRQGDATTAASNPPGANSDTGLETGETDDDWEGDEEDEEDGEDWDDEEDYPESENGYEDYQQEPPQRWPLGLIAVAVVALLLLAAGGYGVIQQRAAMEDEIRELQATLATAADPEEVAAGREALEELEQRYAEQTAAMDALGAENRRLLDKVAALENSLEELQQAASDVPETPPPAKPRPAPPPPAPAAAVGDWFVNFGSYGQQNMAQSWLKKIQPSAGKAVVIRGDRDGRTFYRVRVVGLADRKQAEKVSRELQDAFGVSQLWVGMEN